MEGYATVAVHVSAGGWLAQRGPSMNRTLAADAGCVCPAVRGLAAKSRAKEAIRLILPVGLSAQGSHRQRGKITASVCWHQQPHVSRFARLRGRALRLKVPHSSKVQPLQASSNATSQADSGPQVTVSREASESAPGSPNAPTRSEGASTSGRDTRQVRRGPIVWRRKREGEPLQRRSGLPPEVVESMRMLKGEREPEMIKSILLRLERVSRGLVVNAFDEFEKRGDPRCCINVLQFILDQGNYQHETRLVNKAINLLVRLRAWEALDSLLAEVKRERVELDVVTYNSLMRGYATIGDADRAMLLMEKMVNAGVKPDSTTYNQLMSAYVKSGDIARAAGVVDEMKTAGVAPNVFHFSVIFSAYARAEDVEGALSVFYWMQNEGVKPDAVLYQLLINLLNKSAFPARAREFLDEMKAEGFRPTVLSYTKVLEGYSKLGLAAEADELFRIMIADGFRPTLAVYASVMTAHIKAGDLTTARGLLQEAIDRGVRLDKDQISFGTFTFLVRESVKKGEVAEAEAVLQKLRRFCLTGNEMALTRLQTLIDDAKVLTGSSA